MNYLFLTAKQIARSCRYNLQPPCDWARQGIIPSIKPNGRTLRFDEAAVAAALKREDQQDAAPTH